MVKNVSGGSGQKSKGRKYEVKKRSVLRMPEEEGEEIGYVTKNEGGGICRVLVMINNKEKMLRGHIRGKFRSRNRKDNNISSGSVVMIGLRNWEGEEHKECDILEVYDQEEVKLMQSNASMSEKLKMIQQRYQNSISPKSKSNDSNEIDFTMDALDPHPITHQTTTQHQDPTIEEEINIDDI
jgi:hypothetical protein